MLKLNGIQLDDFSKTEQEDQVRKIQRTVAELVRRIDSLHQAAQTVEDVFSVSVLGLRVRLRELTYKLLRSGPGEQGLRYQELYWKKGWHEPVSLARQLGAAKGELGSVLLESHLMAGTGHYQNLLLSLREEFGWPSELKFDFFPSYPGFGASENKKSLSGNDLDWLFELAGRLLIWLGDLSRYRMELPVEEGEEERERRALLARKYYGLATRLQPGLGLPYNQLATLVAHNPLDQVFFYLKCVTSREKFAGGEQNLSRLLERAGHLAPTETGGADQIASNSLLILVAVALGEGKGEEDLILACQQNLSNLHQAVAAGVAGDWLTKCVACVILLVDRLGPGTTNLAKVGLCQAWLVAVVAHLAGQLVVATGRQLWGNHWREDEAITLHQQEKEEEDKEPEKKEEGKKKRKRIIDLFRRRRARGSGSSGDDSDLSEEEEDTRSLASSSEEDKDNDDKDDLSEDEEADDLYFSESDDNDEEDVVVEGEEEKENGVNMESVLAAVESSGIFPALWLACLWLRSQPEVLAGVDTGGSQLWTNLGRLFTLLHLGPRVKGKDSLHILPSTKVEKLMAKSQGDEPLLEEFYLRGGSLLLEDQLSGRSWHNDPARHHTLTRLIRLEKWREWVCSLEACPLRWMDGRAVLSSQPAPQPDKKCVMKHMAELWLKEEVSQMEADKGQCYIILDAAAFTTDLATVKRVAGFRRFVSIVPSTVIHQLDAIKKINRSAREAIRWLERELGRGHKGIRAQERGEEASLPWPQPARREEGRARYQVLECVAHFSKNHQVMLVTGDSELVEEQDPRAAQLLDELGVSVEQVEGFMARHLGINNQEDRAHIRIRNGERKSGRRWRRDGGGRGRSRVELG